MSWCAPTSFYHILQRMSRQNARHTKTHVLDIDYNLKVSGMSFALGIDNPTTI